MNRNLGAALAVSAGLFGAGGCASTARPMLFHRNQPAPPCPADHAVPYGEGPILTDGAPMTTVPGTVVAPGVVTTPPPGTVLPPRTVPVPTAPPATPIPPLNANPPVGPQPRTTPTPNTNPTQFQPSKST
jgi:hypothetical protein